MLYDFLIVGAGLYGAVCARVLTEHGYRCLVVEKRDTVGGNCYTEYQDDICVHKYGAHIFHTNNVAVWDFVRRFAEFMPYTHAPITVYKNEVYNLPFNMNTFARLWGITSPEQAQKIIKEQCIKLDGEPKTLEELALSTVGKDIYNKLIKGYTEKQWGRPCSELPPQILGRLPIRFVYDNNYFDAMYQGIPIGGYTRMILKMLQGVDVVTGVDFLENREVLEKMSGSTIYTGAIDAYFNYSAGDLEWRSLRFEHTTLDTDNYQGTAVVNIADADIPYTRVIEHRHFDSNCNSTKTVITKEFPAKWEQRSQEKYYPVNDKKNLEVMGKYRMLAEKDKRTVFGGRLGEYAYIDMDETVARAIARAEILCKAHEYRRA